MRKPLRFKRKKKRTPLFKRRFFWYGAGALSLFVFLFWAVVFSPWLEMREVKVEGANDILKEQIAAAAEKSFWQSFLGIPQNSIFLADLKGLKEELQETFPALASVSVRRSLPNSLVIQAEEREQVGIWCLPAQAGKDALCFALDQEGIPFKETGRDTSYPVFRSAGTAVLGEELIRPSLISLFSDFEKSFEADFSVSAFEIEEQGQLQVMTEEGWKILLDAKEDMAWQKTKLQAVLQEKVPPEKRGNLEYIDLRFGAQAYIKYRD